jgi:hypothetical protein
MIYLAEQVSHHPPISAFRAEYGEYIRVHGCYFPKGKMVSLNCAASIGHGSFIVEFPLSGVSYEINFPSAYVSGIVAGTPKLELGGLVRIVDRTVPEIRAEVEFLRKGWISGSYDEVHCRVTAPELETDSANKVYEYKGVWHEKIYPVDPRRMDKKPGAPPVEPFFDPVMYERLNRRSHRPLALDCGGHPKQSRFVWRNLTTALRSGKTEAAAAAKHAVETAQRAERKRLIEEGKVHVPVFFAFTKGSVKDASDEDRCSPAHWEFLGRDQMDMH